MTDETKPVDPPVPYKPQYDPNTGILLNPLPPEKPTAEPPLDDDELRRLRRNVLA